MASYSTNEFRKGLKIQIDGTPYQMIEMNFRKPGKGAALYECKLKNLIRGTVTDKTYRAGQSLEAADVSEFTAQFLYRQGDSYVFMKNDDYEQYELSQDQVGEEKIDSLNASVLHCVVTALRLFQIEQGCPGISFMNALQSVTPGVDTCI